MMLRRSRFVHLIPLADDRVLAVHAITHLRVPVNQELAALINYFDTPHTLTEALSDLSARLGYEDAVLRGCLSDLYERGVITDKDQDQELADTAGALGDVHGRDPGELLDQYRRKRKEGSHPYWSVGAALGPKDIAVEGPRFEVLLLGDCDLQMEGDFLRRAGVARGMDLRVVATFPDDTRIAGERPHDVIVVGALRSRHLIALDRTDDAHRPYVAEARTLLDDLRTRTAAPILIDNLPEPTVQPLGFADRGPTGHRNRFRRANMALEALAQDYADVHVVDVAAALGAEGAARLLDDGLVSFSHFGSPGWMLQRPESEKAAVHGLFPDTADLAALIGDDPYAREAVVAQVHVDAISVVLGAGRKKCVIVDLDGVLWPGVLAETGAPFAWTPETSGAFSYVGLYFGIHEALRALKARGILLACVSKNDEAAVRELWTYPDGYPLDRLLQLDDFATLRINWNDKSENIRSIAEELGFSLDTFLFLDDHPLERERVRQKLPEVALLGENLFAVRQALLTDPRLQTPYVTEESGARTALVKAQLERTRMRADMVSENEFIQSLDVRCQIEQLAPGAHLDRLRELFERTTQFNTTGLRLSVAELAAMLDHPEGRIFTLKVKDRFGDHGLVGGAILSGEDILGFALSCRVIGLGVEHIFLQDVLGRMASERSALVARIVETSRNMPVRNLYRDNGFILGGDGRWTVSLAAVDAVSAEAAAGR